MSTDPTTEPPRIDDLVAVVAALLAGTNDRVYPAHAKLIVEPLERLAADASARDDRPTATSLVQSLERVRSMIPNR